MRILGKAAIWLIGLVVLGAIAGGLFLNWRLQSSLPWTEGSRRAPGLEAKAEIIRDTHGIPHIAGETLTDALFGLGYAHAQDRLWQMDTNRRAVYGRLSEALGERALGIDIQLRTYDFARNLEASWAVIPEETKALVHAYTAGVNAVLNDPDFVAPPEYVLLGLKPEPWRAIDCLAIFKLMGLDLSGNAWSEFQRAHLADLLGEDKARVFTDPPHVPLYVSLDPADLPQMTPPQAAEPASETPAGPMPADGAREGLEAIDASPADQSNNWVVSGAHTATGAPMLANDPHLGTSQPGIWYLAHLALPDDDIVGVSIPGTPAIVLGHNQMSAWGMTNTGPDIQDLYIITRHPDDPMLYQGPDGWERFDSRTETIKVNGGEDVTRTFLRSRHGVILPKDHSRFADLGDETQEVALAYTLNTGPDRSITAVTRLMQAENWDDMTAATADYLGPMQNLVVAFRDGDIGYIAAGRAPVRTEAHDTGGLRPVDGTQADNDWQGLIPLDGQPKVRNPQSGKIITANNRMTPEGYPYDLTLDWAATDRAARIHSLLDERDRHDLQSMTDIQLDTVTLKATRLTPLLTAVPASEGLASEARALLADWDGSMAANRAEPLIYAAWVGHLGQRIYADDLGDEFQSAWGLRENFLISVLDGTHPAWCDDLTTDGLETCDVQVRAALDDTVAMLRAEFGPDMMTWRWGDAHKAHFAHQPFDAVPVLGSFFSRSISVPGGSDTPNVAPFSVRSMPDFTTQFTASFRAVYDLARPERSTFMITTGQSGHVLSPHYDDMMPKWAAGETITIERDLDLLRGTGRVLTLKPAPAE